MHARIPRLTADTVRFEFVSAEPRADERLRRFHGTADAELFLQQFSATLTREALLSLLGEGRGFGTGRMGDRELRGEVAVRLARGELRVVEVSAVLSIPASGRGGALTVLRWPDRPRPGESVQHFHGADDALRFLEGLHADPWSRRGVAYAARRATAAFATDPAPEVLRRFAGQLAAGRAQLVRLPDPEVARAVALAPSHSGAAQVPLAAAALRPRFQLCDIPDVMERRLRWPVSARLMRRWFMGAYYRMELEVQRGAFNPLGLPPEKIDEGTVTMRWALQFGIVANAYAELIRGGWNTTEGRKELRAKIALVFNELPVHSTIRFGNLSHPARVLDRTCQVNLRPVGGLFAPLDDFYGAIGRANLKIAVSGLASRVGGDQVVIVVDEVGVYLRDTYDFNDDPGSGSQPLGSWGWDGVAPPLGAARSIAIDRVYGAPEVQSTREEEPDGVRYAVRNEHFFRYREKHGRGGDFVIFSDVLRTRLPVAIPITIHL